MQPGLLGPGPVGGRRVTWQLHDDISKNRHSFDGVQQFLGRHRDKGRERRFMRYRFACRLDRTPQPSFDICEGTLPFSHRSLSESQDNPTNLPSYVTWPNNTQLINPKFLSTPNNLPINNLCQGAPFKPKQITQSWRKKTPSTLLPDPQALNSDVEGNGKCLNEIAKEGS